MIDAVIDRLKASVPAFKLVGEANDFQAAAEKNPNIGPAVFVFSTGDSAEDSKVVGRVRQKVTTTIAVVYAVKNVGNAQGAGNSALLDTLKQSARAALMGWQPDGTVDPLSFVSGNQLAFRQGWQWWMDSFKTQLILNP